MADFETYMREGCARAAEERHQEAFDQFVFACQQCPEAATAWSNRAGTAFLLGRMDEADQSYQKALQCGPSLWEARFGLIRLHIAQRHIDQARKFLNEVSPPDAQAPEEPEWHYLSGILQEMSGAVDEASTLFQRAATAGHPHAPKALHRLLIHQDRPAELVKVLCCGVNPAEGKTLDPLLLLAILKAFPAVKSRWQFARAFFHEFPDHPFLYDLMASGFLAMHDYAYAARTAACAGRQIPGLDPNDWPSLKECSWYS